MRTYLILLVLILGAALVAPYFLEGPEGQTHMEARLPVELLPGAVGEGDTVYRWQDEQGVWQFGETPPPGVQAHAVVLESASRITPLEGGWQGESPQQSKTVDPQSVTSPLGLMTQGPGMLEAAKAARDQLNGRTGDRQKLLEQVNSSQ